MRRILPAILFLVAAACAGSGDAGGPPAGEALAAIVPKPGPRWAPSQMEIAGGGSIDGTWMSEVDSCNGCHTDVVAQWQTSAHAFASFNNPIYRVSVDRFRAEVGAVQSRHCGGCHDVALMVAGAMDGPIEPGDLRAHAGVTCKTCHGITETRSDGNGSYTLTSDPIPIPRPGDAESVRVHKERVALKPLRDGVGLCGSCHRAFLGPETGNATFFAGVDDLGPWRRSAFAGSKLARIDDPLAEKDCRGCHMAREAAPLADVSAKGGTIASHRFLGGHTWLAAMRGDGAQLEKLAAVLRGAATIDVAAAVGREGRTLPADGAKVTPGSRLVLDVVVRNTGVGHRFPGGTKDAQDTWIEVAVEDARGRAIAAHGASGPDEADPAAHRLRALAVDATGTPRLEREVNHFRTAVVDRTLAPRDADVVRYALDVPAELGEGALPLRVTARLRHRSRNLVLQRAACEDAKTARGIAFRGRTPLDPCPAQPIVDVAESVVWLGGDRPGEGGARAPAWRRLLDHGYGLMHAVQEQLDEARPSLERALALLGEKGAPHDRAMVLAALGAIAGREGRTDEALARFGEAARLAPEEPAIARLRGDAFAEVWRWGEAAPPLAEAARAAPGDDLTLGRLAIALASRGGGDREALRVAQQGLAISPRDPDLLHVQAIALGALGAPEGEVAAARGAYDVHRPADDLPAIKTKCAKTSPGCALERIGVHLHVLAPASR